MSADFTDFVGAKSQEDLMESLAFLSFENLCLGLGFFCPFPFFLFFFPTRFWLGIENKSINGEWCPLTEKSFRRRFTTFLCGRETPDS